MIARANVSIDFIENVSTGVCTGAFEHTTTCTNHTSGDGVCDCLADAANLCAKAHDKNWWAFTACMFANNGSPYAAHGLEDDATFESTVEKCSSAHLSYSFDSLKECYTGAEGSQMAFASAARTAAEQVPHPMWVYVDGDLVDTPGPPPHSAAILTAWAEEVKARIMGNTTMLV